MIPCQRHLFDIPDDVAYLNCAYMSPIPLATRDAGRRGVKAKVQPWTLEGDAFFTDCERGRALFAQLIGASADDIAIVPAVSYGMAQAAENLSLKPGGRVLVLADQFPSNLYPWRALAERSSGEVVTVPRPADDDWTAAILAAIDERVGIVALPNCHWTDGGLLDLVRVGERVRAVGAALVLDLTQSLGALPFDVGAVRPDFMVCACYKWLLGPYSVGFLYVAPKHQGGRPIELGPWSRLHAEDGARRLDYIEDWQSGARRYDMGERSNFTLLPMAIASLEQLIAWQPAVIARTLAAGTTDIAKRAATLGLGSARLRAGHFIGLRFPKGTPTGLAERLAKEKIYVSLRGPSLRVTPHLYNRPDEIDRLFAVLGAMI
jgi:selenocysteine lyase/cysteine desulfurase